MFSLIKQVFGGGFPKLVYPFRKENKPSLAFRHLQSRPEKEIQGTDVVLGGVSKEEIERAKANFLQFSNEELLEKTPLGEVYTSPEDEDAHIYVNGLRVAFEENFLFSYNVTKVTKKYVVL